MSRGSNPPDRMRRVEYAGVERSAYRLKQLKCALDERAKPPSEFPRLNFYPCKHVTEVLTQKIICTGLIQSSRPNYEVILQVNLETVGNAAVLIELTHSKKWVLKKRECLVF